ncbi:MAG: alpha-ketoacid dehydrogenase subunit beta [Elusimicrobiota bacterium]|jgi:transketolase|nr:alpha-ketoacid dehydrogenase subunit beta [Elusimicrobiota bacterium]
MFTIERSKSNTEMRMAVVTSLQDLMKTNDKVVALEADLGGASGWTKIKKTNPDRFINVGIAEANMMGIAAGLSVTGFIPFVHSFSPFITRRAYDQIFLSGAYAHTTINIYGSDPGFSAGPNGGTHTSFEDIALMRVIPNSLICDGADWTQLSWIIKNFAKLEGIHYVRANRKAVDNIYKEGSEFEFGKGNIVKKGKDVLIISCGQLVSDALDAADTLEKEGISAEVIDMFTIKPLDIDLILKEAQGKKALISFENHNIIGGLGSAIAEVLAENAVSIPFKRIGIVERFGEVGSQGYLQKAFGLTSQDLIDAVKKIIK